MTCHYPDGSVVTVVDVLQITHAAIATVSNNFLLLELMYAHSGLLLCVYFQVLNWKMYISNMLMPKSSGV